ncbi:hypothetical protein [Ammoniphilus sp. YIM 78166]|uniref:hypothetical protein n=1 Tax=Ammoniphilus sp. YIM 78166 TaxID=1644106 RepID=UPI001431FD0A|nr:hypothetical protein [Ammoniphilus sp. YIM 78166]
MSVVMVLSFISSVTSAAPSAQKVEKQIGYITQVQKQKNGKYKVTIDYIQWFSGEAANRAMREDGKCKGFESECFAPNDFYIRNVNPKLRTFELSKKAVIRLQTFGRKDGNFYFDQKVSLDNFANHFNKNKQHQAHIPYWIELQSGVIVKVTEQYVP